jgi:ATP-binding cassette subfamily B protein
MFMISPILAGIAVMATLLYFLGYRIYQRRAPHLVSRRQTAEADYIAEAEEGLNALYSVRVHGALRGVMRRFSTVISRYLETGFAFYVFTLKFQGGFTSLLTIIAAAAIMVVGGWLVFRGITTVGALIAFTSYVHWLYVFIIFMSDFVAETESALISLERVETVLSWPEGWEVETIKPSRVPLDYPDAIEIKGLDFAIGGLLIFRDLNIEIKNGRMTAILGKSGVGKTTLLNLLLKLYEVPQNKIYIYGRDIAEIPLDELLGLVSVVEQEPRFFSGTLAENLSLSGQAVEKEQVEYVAQQVGIKEFIGSLWAKEMATKLSTLSGGERKRLGLLRGMLQDAPVVLMDEPTAFLDETTGLHILRNIRTNFPHKTIVVFSHDPVVRSLCDEVIELYEV